ncbi:MAG: prenyltransferase/squalene oxidase repeat-containing protein [Terriglobia bacterium]
MSVKPCPADFIARSPEGLQEVPLAEEFCFPFLLRAQNADGGWGYMPGSASGAEPTGWALMALHGVSSDRVSEDAAGLGRQWLCQAQLPNGSWPAFVGQQRGCWVTALACLALKAQQESRDSVARGVRWLCDSWPAEGGFWQRLGRRLRRTPAAVRQDSSLRGWNWTPGTASWVEPTSYSLILLKNLSRELLPPSSGKRVRLAEAMLYDRMCPGGGWNAGNPLVYGVAGIPRVGPTAWALLALLDQRDRPENRKSLDWLSAAFPRIQGPGSLALAHLCLQAHGRAVRGNRKSSPGLEASLRARQAVNQFLMNVPVVAWAAIALSGVPDWLFRIDDRRS